MGFLKHLILKVQSMWTGYRRGNGWDNSPMERFFRSLQK